MPFLTLLHRAHGSTKALILAAAAMCILTMVPVAEAGAQPDNACKGNAKAGSCKITLSHRGGVAKPQQPIPEQEQSLSVAQSRGRAVDRGPRVCSYQGRDVGCATEIGYWNGGDSHCQPIRSETRGGQAGTVYACTRVSQQPGELLPDSGALTEQWRPDTDPPPDAAPVVIDPEQVAWELVASLDLQAIEMGMFPAGYAGWKDPMGYVGWNQWLWVESPSPKTWGPITASETVHGQTVSLKARVESVTWDMGNGDRIDCGIGKPNPAKWRENEPSKDCNYMYELDGYYTVTATSHWVIEWEGVGEQGTITQDLVASKDITIAEIHVLITHTDLNSRRFCPVNAQGEPEC